MWQRAKVLGYVLAAIVTAAETGCYREPQQLMTSVQSGRAYDRARGFAEQGDYGKAIAELNASVQLSPDNLAAHLILGWIHGTCPRYEWRDPDKAVFHARRAVELCPRMPPDSRPEWVALACLAAAYAEAGDFEKAVDTQKKA
ncbi:MAG: tetratricopeptide repeat protein, partial [Planctomycetota bacterium]